MEFYNQKLKDVEVFSQQLIYKTVQYDFQDLDEVKILWNIDSKEIKEMPTYVDIIPLDKSCKRDRLCPLVRGEKLNRMILLIYNE